MSKQNKLVKAIKDPFWMFAAIFRRLSPFIKNDALYLKVLFFFEMRGKILHLKNPISFNEKLQWLKIYDYKPEYTKLVDKLAVKNYVESRIGNKHIIPTLAVWDSVEDIDWNSLPNQFVLKTTHGGGGCGVIVCTDKTKFDKIKAKNKLKKSMYTNAGQTYREKPYLNVPRKIIAEKYIAEQIINNGETKTDLPDYKFFCFNGKVKFFKIDFGRFVEHHANYYSPNGDLLPFGEVACKPDPNHVENMPSNLSEMIRLAETLSANYKFLRVDLYNVNGKIYFGELTFYPAAGMGAFIPEEWDEKLGNLLALS
jgi:hypothetical protein